MDSLLSYSFIFSRLYSRYKFDNRKANPQEFHDWITDGLTKYQDCFDRWSLRHCVYNKTLAHSVNRVRFYYTSTVITPSRNRGGVILLLRFVCLSVSVCVSVCLCVCEQNSSRTDAPIWMQFLLNQ